MPDNQASEINSYFETQRNQRNNSAPLGDPPVMPTIDPRSSQETLDAAIRGFDKATELYTTALLNRKTLTDAEVKWLQARVSEALKNRDW
jgi:hypothetical protein